MTNTLQSTSAVSAVQSLGQIDDEKVSSMLAVFFSTSWTKAKSGNVKAAIDLQHYADRAGQFGMDNPMTKAILQKMEPTAASKLEQAITNGSVISFD